MSAPASRQPLDDARPAWTAAYHRDDVGSPAQAPRGTPVMVLAPERSGTATAPARPPQPRTGWEALTERELEVVELVTLGATNRQTARRLRISPHTVSAHLRHVFDKVGVSSRVELTRVAVAREQGRPSAGTPSSGEGR